MFSLIDTERHSVRPTADFGWTDYHTLEEVSSPHMIDQAQQIAVFSSV
jgi:hypothetical protein